MKNTYKNLEVQYNKLFRHLKVGSFKTRERYGKAFKRFMRFLASRYNLQKLSNISKKHIFAYVKYMQSKRLSASTIKTELAAIRFFHDSMPYTRETLPSNEELDLKRRSFGGVDRTWDGREYNLMLATTMESGHKDYTAIFALARYAGLRLEECFRIDTNDAKNALDTGKLFVKGKGGLTRYVPINEPIKITLTDMLKVTPTGQNTSRNEAFTVFHCLPQKKVYKQQNYVSRTTPHFCPRTVRKVYQSRLFRLCRAEGGIRAARTPP